MIEKFLNVDAKQVSKVTQDKMAKDPICSFHTMCLPVWRSSNALKALVLAGWDWDFLKVYDQGNLPCSEIKEKLAAYTGLSSY